MADLSTKYLGLTLKNPIIVGSCGLTNSVANIQDLENNGAAAVVLRSIFEEEIAFEFEDVLKQAAPGSYNPEYFEYFDYYDYQIREKHLEEYTDLIRESKKSVSIPVIASVNCTYSHEWAFFAKELESAGADALEMNMFFLPTDFNRSNKDKEQEYFDIIERVKNEVSIHIALKIRYYIYKLGPMIKKL